MPIRFFPILESSAFPIKFTIVSVKPFTAVLLSGIEHLPIAKVADIPPIVKPLESAAVRNFAVSAHDLACLTLSESPVFVLIDYSSLVASAHTPLLHSVPLQPMSVRLFPRVKPSAFPIQFAVVSVKPFAAELFGGVERFLAPIIANVPTAVKPLEFHTVRDIAAPSHGSACLTLTELAVLILANNESLVAAAHFLLLFR